MCGIIGYCGYQNAKNIVLDGLKILEYRGYDSAGLALGGDVLSVYKTAGSVERLESILPDINAHTGIGHTRWATHGKPDAINAHPHLSFDKQIAVVHNGVLENCDELRAELLMRGIQPVSDTDSELIAHLLALEDGEDMAKAVETVGKRLKGAASFLAMRAGDSCIYMRRQGASLAVGLADGECFVASDTLALARYTKKIVIMTDGECAVLSASAVHFYKNGMPISKQAVRIKRTPPKPCSCHMRSEIDEIPSALWRTYESMRESIDSELAEGLRHSSRIYLVGCGTAYHAALYGKHIFEQLIGIPCEAIPASELDSLRFYDGSTYAIFITQSGETADTLRAVELAKEKGIHTIAITNVGGSSITFLADRTLNIDAGAEVAVAATKSYNCQLLSLYMLANAAAGKEMSADLLSKLIECVRLTSLENIYEDRIKRTHLFLVGRGQDSVTAREGALKFKEITYKMTDAYAAGELKHGAIALIDEHSTVVVIATEAGSKHRIEATVSELRSRGAHVLALSSVGDIGATKMLNLPFISDALLYPLISILPLQNLALTTSLCLGLNPDKPRNLAKSVTVI